MDLHFERIFWFFETFEESVVGRRLPNSRDVFLGKQLPGWVSFSFQRRVFKFLAEHLTVLDGSKKHFPSFFFLFFARFFFLYCFVGFRLALFTSLAQLASDALLRAVQKTRWEMQGQGRLAD